MKLADAINSISAPVGMTSAIAALHTGNLAPVSGQSAVDSSLQTARGKLAEVTEAQRTCGSDWAWWGYEGQVAYWRAVVSLHEAAQLVGHDNLPDVAAPSGGGVVMDLCAKVERFGQEVLKLAREQAVRGPSPGELEFASWKSSAA